MDSDVVGTVSGGINIGDSRGKDVLGSGIGGEGLVQIVVCSPFG